MVLTLVAMADTHGFHGNLEVPSGDVLIHAGDMMRAGKLDELRELNEFLAALPHEHKIVVAGNHDWCFERHPTEARAALSAATYLQDERFVIDGVRFWGAPWQPEFLDWAFNLPRGAALAERWALIPDDTDVLITHGPPAGYGDRTFDGSRVGCEDLLRQVLELRPKLHIFGHIHEGRGTWREGATTFVNATTNFGAAPPVVLTFDGDAR